ncbi:CehA/McbA family metallohydrolase [uncultured Sphingomonas sp.]|mgnify:CR=1 FL=1|uniref:CehA/McbA family metallohydrolase n=1 Tax=uncultured Sphingomonas sp. TaxID=158754 RepID=UPI0025D5DFF2|nr:CehA/McbA family metallohydrolase [uncultured Sphingomonas sp.]
MSLRTFGVALAMAVALPAPAAVRIIRGPTPIVSGQASAPGDITLMNDRLAVGLAVETAPPWAIPRGALIDAAPVVGGVIGKDRLTFGDFLPNSWIAWPSSRQDVRIVKQHAGEAIVEAVRNWADVEIRTCYTLREGEDAVHLSVEMTNRGTKPVEQALSGFVLWTLGGHFFGVPGIARGSDGPTTGAMADRIVGYDRDWAIAMHMADFDRFGFGGRDLYRRTTLQPGESRTFQGTLQVVPRGDLAPIVAAELAGSSQGAAHISGQVTQADGTRVAAPVVVAEKDGTPFAWTLGQDGRYALSLPPGRYRFYATGQGYNESKRVEATLAARATRSQDFSGLQPPGRVRLTVREEGSAAPLDARIGIVQGQQPLVEYLGRSTFFTALDHVGDAEFALAPGEYRLSVGSGAGFTTKPATVTAMVAPGQTWTSEVRIPRLFRPEADGWYAADMHHHSDQADGSTPPADVARSELAAGLDLLFVSDHDLTTSHRALAAIAARRGVPFIPSAELSPSWGHFNVYPVKLDEPVRLEMATASAADVFAEAHRLGATAIQVNHPYVDGEGYLSSVDRGVAHGGFDPAFDLLEINGSSGEGDGKVVDRAWASWSTNRPYFLSAGSDVHDVWNSVSGSVRVYAHVDGPLTAGRFVDAVRRGQSYVTRGPLITPDHDFGTTVAVAPRESVTIGFKLQSTTGLKRASIVHDGKVERVVDYAGQATALLSIPVITPSAGWYALTVEDTAGKRANTNPIWIAPRR